MKASRKAALLLGVLLALPYTGVANQAAVHTPVLYNDGEEEGVITHKCELKQAILVKLLYGTRYSGFFGIAFFLTNNVNTFYL